MKKVIAIIIWIISVIIAYSIEETIKNLEWFKALTGIMKIIFENIGVVLIIILSILLVYLLIKWEIQSKYISVKKKILAQKKFIDFAFIDIADHINREVKELELRCNKLEKKIGIYQEPNITPSDNLAFKREQEIKDEKSKEYSIAFKDWVDESTSYVYKTMYRTREQFNNESNPL